MIPVVTYKESTFKGGYIPHLYFILRDGKLEIRWMTKGRTREWTIAKREGTKT